MDVVRAYCAAPFLSFVALEHRAPISLVTSFFSLRNLQDFVICSPGTSHADEPSRLFFFHFAGPGTSPRFRLDSMYSMISPGTSLHTDKPNSLPATSFLSFVVLEHRALSHRHFLLIICIKYCLVLISVEHRMLTSLVASVFSLCSSGTSPRFHLGSVNSTISPGTSFVGLEHRALSHHLLLIICSPGTPLSTSRHL